VLEQPSRLDLTLDGPCTRSFGSKWRRPILRRNGSAWPRTALKAGASLVFSGRSMPLLNSYAAVSGGQQLGQGKGRPDIVFDDFENGYSNWRVEGTASWDQAWPRNTPSSAANERLRGQGSGEFAPRR
jgi:hypothetical protein